MLNITGARIPILGSRLILNLREAYYRPFEEEFAMNQSHVVPTAKFSDSRRPREENTFEMSVTPVKVQLTQSVVHSVSSGPQEIHSK